MKCQKKINDKVINKIKLIIDKITSNQTFINTKKNYYNDRTPENLENFYKIYIEYFINEYNKDEELKQLEKKLKLTLYLNETDNELKPLLFLPIFYGFKLSLEEQLNEVFEKINFTELNESLLNTNNIYSLKIQILLKYMNDNEFSSWKKVKTNNLGEILIKNTNSFSIVYIVEGLLISEALLLNGITRTYIPLFGVAIAINIDSYISTS